MADPLGQRLWTHPELGPQPLRRVAQLCAGSVDVKSMTSGGSTYEVDPKFFEDRDADMGFVVHTAEVDSAARAIERAKARLILVTFDGREFADDAALWQEVLATNGAFGVTNASYIADTERSETSLSVYVDSDGAAPAAMGSTFVRVISEELIRSGVRQARLTPM